MPSAQTRTLRCCRPCNLAMRAAEATLILFTVDLNAHISYYTLPSPLSPSSHRTRPSHSRRTATQSDPSQQ